MRVFKHGAINFRAGYTSQLCDTMPNPDAPLLKWIMYIFCQGSSYSANSVIEVSSKAVVDDILTILNEVYCKSADWTSIRREAVPR